METPGNVLSRVEEIWMEWKSDRVYRLRVRPLIDLDGFKRIRERYVSGDPPYTGYSKYFDIDTYCKRDVRRAMLLGLHRAGKKSVLDLGCGMGYFLLATEIFGHSPLGIDIAESEKYQDVIDFLKLERVIFEIKAGLPLPPLGRTFDLVTAFQVTFNNLDRPDQWGPSEWNFFLKDVGSHMNPGGELFLQLNPTKEGFLYGEDLRALYLRKGATLRGSTVRLPASGLLKE